MSNAPVPVPRTFGVNEFETAAYLNSVRDALNYLLNPPLVTVVQTSTQTVPATTYTGLSMQSTIQDTYGSHSNVTNPSRITAQVAGTYEFSGVSVYAANTTGSRGAGIGKNGTVQQGSVAKGAVSTISDVDSRVTPTWQVAMLVGDYVELLSWNNIGGGLATSVASDVASSLNGRWVHA
jgi:hypothetical protein